MADETWLDSLGAKLVQDDGDRVQPLPILNFVGATVTPDPTNKKVDIAFSGGTGVSPSSCSITLTGNGTLDVTSGMTSAAYNQATRVELNPTSVRILHGMKALVSAGAMEPSKTLVNVGSYDVILEHLSGSVVGGSQNQFSIPTVEGTSYTLKPGEEVSFGGGYDYVASLWKKPQDADSLTTGVLWSALITQKGRRVGEERRISGVPGVGYGAGRARWHSGTSPGAVTGMVGPTFLGGYWKRVYSGMINVQWFGAIPDSVMNINTGVLTTTNTDNTAAIQAAFKWGGKAVYFPDGPVQASPGASVYRTTYQLILTQDVSIHCDNPESATIYCDGSDWDHSPWDPTLLPLPMPHYAMVVNGGKLLLADRSDNINRFCIKNLRVSSPNGGGIFLGSTINPFLQFDSVFVRHCATRGIECGQSTYFFSLYNCGVSHCAGGGFKTREACDMMILDSCWFGFNSCYDVDICSPTFFITNCDFELHTGVSSGVSGEVAGFLCIRTSSYGGDSSGYGRVVGNRFGPEILGTGVAHADVHILNSNGGVVYANTLRGLKFEGNHHFAWHTNHKHAAYLVDSGVGGLDIIRPVFNGLGAPGALPEPVVGYSSPYLITTSNPANVLASTLYAANFVDEMELVDPSILAVFQPRATTEIKYQRAVAGLALTKWGLVFGGTTDPVGRSALTPRVYPLSNAAYADEFTNDIIGMALVTTAQDGLTQIATAGTLIATTLNASALRAGDPVYMGASGELSLTPHSAVVKVVGRILYATTNAPVELDFSEPARWVAMPTKGKWKIGDFAPKAVPVIAGTSPYQYMIKGWTRLTDAAVNAGTGVISNNVLGTDWAADYMPVGTTSVNSLTASTTQTQGQGPLVAGLNITTTVANANDTVTLPVAAAGVEVSIINTGANRLKVFPASGDDLGNGVNKPCSVVPGGMRSWVARDATTWSNVADTKPATILSDLTVGGAGTGPAGAYPGETLFVVGATTAGDGFTATYYWSLTAGFGGFIDSIQGISSSVGFWVRDKQSLVQNITGAGATNIVIGTPVVKATSGTPTANLWDSNYTPGFTVIVECTTATSVTANGVTQVGAGFMAFTAGAGAWYRVA